MPYPDTCAVIYLEQRRIKIAWSSNLAIKITDKTYDKEFVKKLEEISGENFHTCMQCGTCTATCPMADEMDVPPRRIMLLSHFGLKEKATAANTIWICATCSSCQALCPRGLKLPKIMEALRQIFLRKNKNYIEPNQIPEEVLADLPQIALVGCFRKHTS
jgi:heterodisulfide reductase subunit C